MNLNCLKNMVFSTFVILTASCSTVRNLSLKTASPMFLESTPGMEREASWENFKEGVPANLKLVEGLLAIRPEDESLLVSAAKGYAGYAFAVHETEFLADKLKEREKSIHKERALIAYSKAIDYGLRFLQTQGVSFDDLRKATQSKEGVVGLLNDELGNSMTNYEGVVFTAQALGSLINLSRENISLVAQLPIAKGMFDWVCTKSPNIGHGICQIFYGSYEAGRPSMLGGDPEKGKEIFEKFIKENPANWLGRIAYLQYYVIPMSDEDIYEEQKKELSRLSDIHQKRLIWSPDSKNQKELGNPQLSLYQAIAIKRFNIIKKYEKDLF